MLSSDILFPCFYGIQKSLFGLTLHLELPCFRCFRSFTIRFETPSLAHHHPHPTPTLSPSKQRKRWGGCPLPHNLDFPLSSASCLTHRTTEIMGSLCSRLTHRQQRVNGRIHGGVELSGNRFPWRLVRSISTSSSRESASFLSTFLNDRSYLFPERNMPIRFVAIRPQYRVSTRQTGIKTSQITTETMGSIMMDGYRRKQRKSRGCLYITRNPVIMRSDIQR